MSKPRKLTKAEAGRLGGLRSAHRLTPEQRSLKASRAGNACLEEHGKEHFVRMNHIRNGRLPKVSPSDRPVAERVVPLASALAPGDPHGQPRPTLPPGKARDA